MTWDFVFENRELSAQTFLEKKKRFTRKTKFVMISRETREDRHVRRILGTIYMVETEP